MWGSRVARSGLRGCLLLLLLPSPVLAAGVRIPQDGQVGDAIPSGPLRESGIEHFRLQGVLGVSAGCGANPFAGEYRARWTCSGGATKAGQRAVEMGLDWLARHQSDRGLWSAAGFTHECDGEACEGDGDSNRDVGVTGLSLLAFLASGNTVHWGKYRRVVRRGTRFLIDSQHPNTGRFIAADAHARARLDHAIAALAVTESYALSRWPVLKRPAQQAVAALLADSDSLRGQHDAANGELIGFALEALVAAHRLGIGDSEARLAAMAAQLAGIAAGNEPAGAVVAVHGDLLLAWVGIDAGIPIEALSDRIVLRRPRWKDGAVEMGAWLFGSTAMHQLGGRSWDTWNTAMLDATVRTQRTEGDLKGSWDPQVDPHWTAGRVGSTALMTLCLESCYRYERRP